MKATMTITNTGDWCLELKAETPTEQVMLAACNMGYGVKCSCGVIGAEDSPTTLQISGESSGGQR
jgi:hypothetical protein